MPTPDAPLVPTSSAPLSLGIIGLGTAGMASALLLSRAGHRVTVYEAVEAPTAIGAGIVLQPTGLSVLAQLGLAESLTRRGHRLDELLARTHRGGVLFRLQYRAVDPALYGLGMHRGALFDALYTALRATEVAVECGVHVADIAQGADRARIIDAAGRCVAEHDGVIVANGARSALRRSAAAPPSRERPYPWGALWFVGEAHAQMKAHTLYQVVHGTHRMVGMLPTGASAADLTPRVTLYWSARGDRVEALRRRPFSEWRDEVLGYMPEAEGIVDQIPDLGSLLYSDYMDVRMRRWHRGRVVFIGDAAHAMSPQLGQGCNIALLDAAALAQAFDETREPAEAFARYSALRRAPLGFYQWANRAITPFFQADGRVKGWLRDAFMGITSRIPPVHEQMVRTMAGVKRGVVRRSLPLSPIRAALPPLE